VQLSKVCIGTFLLAELLFVDCLCSWSLVSASCAYSASTSCASFASVSCVWRMLLLPGALATREAAVHASTEQCELDFS
jgi:hypothetical protein